MLKRPSDSNSALFSVTPRDRLVYPSGTVRSTASNNAPYIDGVRQEERESDIQTYNTHTHPDRQDTLTHKHSDKTQRDTKLSSHFLVAKQMGLHAHTLNSIVKCLKVLLVVLVVFTK